MTLEQLQTILTIAEVGSFRAAAEKLNRSQPALSAAVKNLEDELDLQIFDRSAYRPKLTEAGAAFLRAARNAYESAQLAERIGRELGTKQAETQLRVSVDPLAATRYIEILAKECAKPLVPVSLIVEKSILDSSVERLLNGAIDLAIAPRPEKSRDLEILSLETILMKGAISKKLLGKQKKASRESLQLYPQIFAYDLAPTKETPSRSVGEFSSQQQAIFVPDHATKFKLIAAGIGWGRLCENEFVGQTDLSMIEPKLISPVTLEMSLIRSKKKPLGPVGRAIWSAFELISSET